VVLSAIWPPIASHLRVLIGLILCAPRHIASFRRAQAEVDIITTARLYSRMREGTGVGGSPVYFLYIQVFELSYCISVSPRINMQFDRWYPHHFYLFLLREENGVHWN